MTNPIICSQCQQTMELRKQDTSYTAKKTKFYDRQFLVCHHCDIWMRIERPKEAQADSQSEVPNT